MGMRFLGIGRRQQTATLAQHQTVLLCAYCPGAVRASSELDGLASMRLHYLDKHPGRTVQWRIAT